MSDEEDFLKILINYLKIEKDSQSFQVSFKDRNIKVAQEFVKAFDLIVSSKVLAEFFKEVIELNILVSKLILESDNWDETNNSETIATIDPYFSNDPDVKQLRQISFRSIDFDGSDSTIGSTIEDLLFYTLVEIVSELYRNEKTRPREKLTTLLFKEGRLRRHIKKLDKDFVFNLNPILKDSVFFKRVKSKLEKVPTQKPGSRRARFTTLGRKETKSKSKDNAMLRRLQVLLCCFDPDNEGYVSYDLILKIVSEKFDMPNFGHNIQKKMLEIRSEFKLKSSIPKKQ